MPKIRWTLDQKKHHVTAWRSSGLTREQYCDLYDIPFKSLRQWPQDLTLAERRAKGFCRISRERASETDLPVF
jgi:hypothetical protein